jgi:hypothetical protein
MDPAAGRGRGPRSSASHGRVPGAGNRVAAGEAYSVPELEGRGLHGRRSHNDRGASSLSSGFVTEFSLSPTWPAGQSPIRASHHCHGDPPSLKAGISWRHWRGPREDTRPRGRAVCASHHCHGDPPSLKAGISWRHWRGPQGGREAAGGRRHGTCFHVTFHQKFHQVPVLS